VTYCSDIDSRYIVQRISQLLFGVALASPPKFLVDGYQNHHRSPESLAGFFVSVISRSHPNQLGNFVAVTVRIKAINDGDTLSLDPKYSEAYSTHIPAVILAVNNNPMRFTDRSGGVSRRRVILHFPEIIPADERDPQLKQKISGELAVIVRQLMQRFSQPQQARSLLQSQQNSDEAMRIKRDADPMVDFCGYLFTTAEPNALYIGNASIRPLQPRRYLYHAYLAYMETNSYKNPLSMKMFGLSLESIMREYGQHYMKRRTKLGMQTNLDLTEESSTDWLPKCENPTAA